MNEAATDNVTHSAPRDEIARKLRRAWRKERRFHHVRGICHVLLWLVAMILLDLLVDWQFRLPGWGRPILLAMNVVVLGAVFHRNWWRHLRRYDPVRVALEVEGRHPDLASLLVSYVQMGGGSRGEAAASPALVRAMRRQAVDATSPLDFREIISYGQLKRIAAVSLATVLFFGAVSANWSEFFSALLVRMLNPGADVGYPTRTRIVSVTGDRYARQGEAVQLTAACAGVIPSGATLRVRPDEAAEWSDLRMGKAAADRFSYEFPEALQSFQYRVRCGDDESAVYRVTVLPAPQIVSTAVHVDYPEYTGLADETAGTLNLEVPEGSILTWDLLLDQPVAKAEVLLGTGSISPLSRDAQRSAGTVPVPTSSDRRGQSPLSPLSRDAQRSAGTAPVPISEQAETSVPPAPVAEEMTIADGGRRVQWTTRAVASFPYRFRWTEAVQGYPYELDVRYRVQVRPDRPPEVEIVYPLVDEKATVRKTLEVAFRARDDYRVAAAFLAWSVNGGAEQLRPLKIEPGNEVGATASWTLRESIPRLAEGDTITYAIEVTDNRSAVSAQSNRAAGTPAPAEAKAAAPTAQRRRSASRQLAIVSVPEYLAWMAERNASLAEDIRAMREQEVEASRQVGLIRAPDEETTTQPTTQPAPP